MIEFKENELSHKLFETLQQQFPELELVEILESPVYRDSIWVRLIMPDDEDREIEIREVASELSTDILLNYGYDIGITSANQSEKIAA
jgi:hypothetical protein